MRLRESIQQQQQQRRHLSVAATATKNPIFFCFVSFKYTFSAALALPFFVSKLDHLLSSVIHWLRLSFGSRRDRFGARGRFIAILKMEIEFDFPLGSCLPERWWQGYGVDASHCNTFSIDTHSALASIPYPEPKQYLSMTNSEKIQKKVRICSRLSLIFIASHSFSYYYYLSSSSRTEFISANDNIRSAPQQWWTLHKTQNRCGCSARTRNNNKKAATKRPSHDLRP